MEFLLVIIIFVFLFVSGGLMYLYVYFEHHYQRTSIERRLFDQNTDQTGAPARRTSDFPLMGFIRSLGRLAMPAKESETQSIRLLLTHAGYRSSKASVLFYGIKLGAALFLGLLFSGVLLLSGYASPKNLMLTFFVLGLGYYMPDLILKRQAASRRHRIARELPDAIDLLLICLEAGLGFDMALYRVSRELSDIAPVLSGEFAQYFFEISSGLPKKTVLANLAERNGVEPLKSVVTMLLQSARLGSDVSEGLRVHIMSMRTERRQIAEEKAAKISTKLTFPLIMLILPALFVVILGPAVINLITRLQGGF